MNEIEKSTPRRSHPAWWKYILAVVAFWLLSVFGGIIPMLFNAFGSAPIASYISYLLMIAVYIWGIKRFAKGIRQ